MECTCLSKSKLMENLMCKFYGMLQQEVLDLPPLPSWSPHKCYSPSSFHLTFPLVTRVNLRRPSDFRLTFANIVAVIHEKFSCYFQLVFV